MAQRESIVFALAGVDGAVPRLVARADLIEIFGDMAHSDLFVAHRELAALLTNPDANSDYSDMEAGELIKLLEIHTRAANALQALMALRDPGELVEAHMP